MGIRVIIPSPWDLLESWLRSNAIGPAIIFHDPYDKYSDIPSGREEALANLLGENYLGEYVVVLYDRPDLAEIVNLLDEEIWGYVSGWNGEFIFTENT